MVGGLVAVENERAVRLVSARRLQNEERAIGPLLWLF